MSSVMSRMGLPEQRANRAINPRLTIIIAGIPREEIHRRAKIALRTASLYSCVPDLE